MTGIVQRLSLSALPETLSIFPLSGALLLPHAKLPLNIFEPRYLAMLDDALRSDLRFIGMIQPKGPGEDAPLFDIGCAGRVSSFSETDDGRYLIVLTGISRFRIQAEISGFEPFRRVTPDWSPFASDLARAEAELDDDERDEFDSLMRRYLASSNLSADWDALARADDETLVNALCMMCPFSTQEKQALLEAGDFETRKESLKALMKFAVASPAGGGELQ